MLKNMLMFVLTPFIILGFVFTLMWGGFATGSVLCAHFMSKLGEDGE